MRYNYLLFGLLFVTVSSCSVKEINNPEIDSYHRQSETKYYTIIEEQPGNVDTKTYADSQLRVLWNEGDHVTIFDKKTLNEEFCFDGEDGDNSGGFYPAPSSGGGYVSYSDLAFACAVYPYQKSTKISYDGIVTFTLPEEQIHTPNSFGRGANTMIAKTETNQLKFKNVCGYLSFKFYGQGVSVTSIDLKGNNGEFLAGKCTISMESGDPVTTMASSNTSDQITLICSTPVELSSSSASPTEFWIVVPPTTFSQGITFTVHTSDGGVFERSSNANFTLGRNKKMQIPVMEVIPEYVQPNNVIYYTSTDGKIVTPYAADVFGANIVSNTYENGRGVLTFDGDVTSIGNSAFYQCVSLSSVTIPKSVKSIGQEAFYSCTSLFHISIPDNITAIQNNTFTYCSSLSSIVIPQSVTTIGSAAFSNTGLTAINIPKNVTNFGSYPFSGCGRLETITVDPGNPKYDSKDNSNAIIETESKVLVLGCKNTVIPVYISTIGKGAFCGCSGLSSIFIPDSVIVIDEAAFQDCASLSSVTIPNSVSTLGKWAFSRCSSLTSIIIPDSVSSIGYMCFTLCSGLGEIQCLRETPPSGGQYMFDYTYCPIFVPERSVDAYKSKTYWRDYKSRIQAIPSSPIHVTNITFDRTSLSIPVGRSKTITATILPEDATNKTITWASSNTDVATVYLGKITAVQTGSCTITATTYDGGMTATCHVTVVPVSDPSFYSSTDYSKDGEVVLLHEATVGNGVNLILLGDGFVDTDMAADGLYDKTMSDALDRLFLYEPYKSLKNRFNLYYVRAVSANNVYGSEQSDRKFSYELDGELVFRSSLCFEYAGKVPNPNNQPLKVALLFNINQRIGRSFCSLELQSGRALAFILDVDEDVFCHELGGHGFAFLADEYEEYSGSFTQQATLDQQYQYYGFGANVDWRNDISSVKWSRFITDNRYSRENIGLYEGAYLYPRGIYRPTYNSMMRNQFLSTGKAFNAPSREQIYKTIMKYSEGSSWSYDYEEFVAIDEAGRNQAISVFNTTNYAPSRNNQKGERAITETHLPPVILDQPIREIRMSQNGSVELIP